MTPEEEDKIKVMENPTQFYTSKNCKKEEKRTSELLSNQTLLSKLPDNGERAHAKKQDLEKQIEQLRLSIESL